VQALTWYWLSFGNVNYVSCHAPPLHERAAALSALLQSLSTEGPTSCQHS